MINNFIEKPKPINFVIYIALFFCFFLIAVISDELQIVNIFKNIATLIALLLIFFFYNFIVTKNKLTLDQSYAFLIYILISIPFIKELLYFKNLILIFVYFLFLRKIYSLRTHRKIIEKNFDSGFWLSILFVLEPYYIVLFFLIFASNYLQQKMNIHTIFTSIFGFLAPLILYFTYLFWFDSTDVFLKLIHLELSDNFYIESAEGIYEFFVGILIFITLSIFLKSQKAIFINNSFKKNWILLIINFLLTAVFIIIKTDKNESDFLLLLTPASIIIANGFETIKSNLIKIIAISIIFIGAVSVFEFRIS